MKTIQMTLDEVLLVEVDQAVKQLGTTRSEFTRQALRQSLKKWQIHQLEAKHQRGYMANSTKSENWDDWESEQVWGD